MISSVEQSIRGMRHNENRPDLIILDDIEDIQSVKTKAGRDKAFNWLVSEIIPAGSPETRIIVVGNLLHEDSVLKRLQKKIENKEITQFNAVYREYPIVDLKGNPLWPGKYPTLKDIEIEREKTMDEIAWYREYMLQIISSKEQVVRPERITTYDKLPDKSELRMVCVGVDLAISEKDSADYTAVVVAYVYGRAKELKIYIQPYPYNQRSPFPAQAEYIKSLYAVEKSKHHRVKIYIEEVSYQKAMVQYLEVQKCDVEGVQIGRNDKTARLRLTTPMLKEKRILFPEKGCEELIDQLLGFGKEKYDDLADAFSIVILKIIEENPINFEGEIIC